MPAIIAVVIAMPSIVDEVKLKTVFTTPRAATAVLDIIDATIIWLRTAFRSIEDAEPTAEDEPVTIISPRSFMRSPLNENLKIISFFVKWSSIIISAAT